MASISILLGALARLLNVIPETVEQYRKDHDGFWQAQRMAGIYVAYALVGIVGMLLLAVGREPHPQSRSFAIVMSVVFWLAYGGVWLARLLPKDEEMPVPAWLDKRPSFVDAGMIAAFAVAVVAALLL